MSYPSANESPTEYHDRLCNATNGTPVMIWKTLKGFAQAILLFIVAHVGATFGAEPTVMYPLGLVAGLAVLVGEVKEIEMANALTVTFKRKDQSNEDDGPGGKEKP